MAYTYAEADPGSGGPKFAVDEIAGVQTPVSKLAFGAEGTATPVSGTDPLPVELSAVPLPTGAATEATLAAVEAKLPALSGGAIPVVDSNVAAADLDAVQQIVAAYFAYQRAMEDEDDEDFLLMVM